MSLTVNETLRYFGILLHLKKNYINERISAVNELLALPPGNRFISHCTSMERKQVSFAVAIFHEPELIILDEPDQGVDPVTKKSISDHLIKITQSGCTVFMTSKNILEAETASRLGIIRSGYLLMEGSPKELASTHKQKNVESLYTHIYSFAIRKEVPKKVSVQENPYVKVDVLPQYGSDGFLYKAEEEDKEFRKTHRKFPNPFRRCKRAIFSFLPNFRRLGMLLFRDTLLSFRNVKWLCFILLVPLLILLLINFTIGQIPTNLKLAIVNFEATEDECKTDPHKYVSCDVVNLIDSNIISKKYYDSYESAEEDSYKLGINGILIIGEKFTNQIMRTMANIDLNNVDIGNPDTSQLILRPDATSSIIASTIEHYTKQAVEEYLNEATKNTSVQNANIGYPLKVGVPLYGRTHTESEYIANGMAVVLLYHLAAFIASYVLISHRESHMLTRDYVAGVRWSETVLSQLIIYGVLLIIEGLLMYGILIWINNDTNQMLGSHYVLYSHVLLVLLLQIWCGLCLGILIANIVRDNVHAGIAIFCFLLMTIFLCGIIWPLNGLPDWLVTIVKYFPQTQAIFLIRCYMQRGITSDTTDFNLGYIAPLVWLLIFILLTILINKIS
ncbi:ABC transporter G family member 20-like isoform X2 [Onthophagus taurus]|nr:ABC transporter G family member 20-like isoform X2 [Onthophagus taurus]